MNDNEKSEPQQTSQNTPQQATSEASDKTEHTKQENSAPSNVSESTSGVKEAPSVPASTESEKLKPDVPPSTPTSTEQSSSTSAAQTHLPTSTEKSPPTSDAPPNAPAVSDQSTSSAHVSPTAPVTKESNQTPVKKEPSAPVEAKPSQEEKVPQATGSAMTDSPAPSQVGPPPEVPGIDPSRTGPLPPEYDLRSSSKEKHEPKPSTEGKCPICGHKNRPGVLICENCGTSLVAGQPSLIGTRSIEDEEDEDDQEAAAKPLKSSEFTPFEDNMVLRLEIEGTSTAVIVQPSKEIILGRRDPNTGATPDIDLTPHAGYRMGVSRRHAAIRLQEKQLNIADLGSSNGTFVNGMRLSAHWPSQINDGDEIRLGQMAFKLQFVKAPSE